MQQVQREEFTGPGPALSRAIAKAERGKTRTVTGGIMLAVVALVVGFTARGLDIKFLLLPLLVLVYGLMNLVGGLMDAHRYGREAEQLKAAPPPPEVVWYALDEVGLTILTDANAAIGDAGLMLPWATMLELTPLADGTPNLRLKYRLPKAPAPAAVLLATDRSRTDGVQFGDRMRAMFDARVSGQASTALSTPVGG